MAKDTLQSVEDAKKEPTKVELAIEAIQMSAPHVRYAWINSIGQYHYHPRPGFKKYYVGEGVEKVETEVAIGEPVAAKQNDGLEF
jgi:hypothetical protein